MKIDKAIQRITDLGEEAKKNGDIKAHLEYIDLVSKLEELKQRRLIGVKIPVYKILQETAKEIREGIIRDRSTEFDAGFNVGIETAARIVEKKIIEID